MKNNKLILILTVLMLGISTASFAAVGDLVKDVASIPGKVVKGTGEVVGDVGRAITPETQTGSAAEAIVQAPGQVVETTGKVVEKTGEAITPGKEVETMTVAEPMTTTTMSQPKTNGKPMKTKKIGVVSTAACPFGENTNGDESEEKS